MKASTSNEDIILLHRLHESKGLSSNKYKCAKCKNILTLYGCSKCSSCSKIFCKQCSNIELCVTCGNRNTVLNSEFYSQLGEIEIICKYEEEGCKEIIPYKNIINHQFFCHYSSSLYCYYCNKELKMKKAETHHLTCKKMKIKYRNCGFSSKRKNHDHQCELENFSKLFYRSPKETQLKIIIDLLKNTDLTKEEKASSVQSLILTFDSDSEKFTTKDISKNKSNRY